MDNTYKTFTRLGLTLCGRSDNPKYKEDVMLYTRLRLLENSQNIEQGCMQQESKVTPTQNCFFELLFWNVHIWYICLLWKLCRPFCVGSDSIWRLFWRLITLLFFQFSKCLNKTDEIALQQRRRDALRLLPIRSWNNLLFCRNCWDFLKCCVFAIYIPSIV